MIILLKRIQIMVLVIGSSYLSVTDGSMLVSTGVW